METRIVEVEEFRVKGYELQGTLSEIPGKWDYLNGEIAKRGVVAEESFGICLSMKGGELHYIAGIKSNLAEGLTDTKEVIIRGGRFIVAKVDGGIPAISTTFDAILKMDDIQLRDGYGMERYIHAEGSTGYEIEVWMPVE